MFVLFEVFQQGFQPLDSGLRQNDGIRSKLRGIEPIEIKPSNGKDYFYTISDLIFDGVRLDTWLTLKDADKETRNR